MVDEIQLLRRVDPARGVGGSGALDDRARADLQRLLADPGPLLPTVPAPFVPVPLARARTVRRPEPVPVATGKRWSSRRRSAMAGAATVALVLAVLALSAVLAPGRGGPPPAFAATPPVLRAVSTSESVGTVLGHLARVAAAQTATPRDLRRVSYEHWSLANRINGRTVTVAVVPEQVQLSWKPDGSAVSRVVAGQTYFPTEAYRRAWEQQGRPEASGTLISNEEFAPGQYRPVYPSAPPASWTQLRAYLATAHPIDSHGTGELFTAVTDLAREWRTTPAVDSALMGVLAQAPGVRILGTVTDRAGRTGTAVATDSSFTGLPIRYVLVFDPHTGSLLASEQWLTTTAGALDVPVPSVIAYHLWR
jgi:hypothetical protein